MRKRLSVYPLLLAAGLFLPYPLFAAEESDTGEETQAAQETSSPWPLKFTQSGSVYIVYPPRFETWENDVLRGRAAVSVQPEGEERPNFGSVSLSARTRDEGTERVVISGVVIQDANFPAAADRADQYLRVLRERLATKSWQTASDRLHNDIAIEHTARQVRSEPVRNDPPRIVLSQQPAVLVPIDGAPVMREVDQSRLLRVVNTRALMLFDKTGGVYYVSVAGHWMSARSLDGPWTESREIGDELERAKEIAVRTGQVDLLEEEGEPVAAQAPVVYVSTAPTELLQTEGPVEYTPIPDTQLLYVSNSPDKIFFDMRKQRFLVLLAGRWYGATELGGGRWEYVPADNLPADFARIPDDHPMAVVRSAIPGTPQAEEAVIANTVPQVATIRRDAARIDITYDGEPEFRPIEGTSLHYAVNSPIPVIRVNADDYYALDNGVWFTAHSPYGAWSVATDVPAAIYTIPRSSPLHYVTYVRVYGETAETVDYGYTPGYVGSYVSNSTVVYGTGYTYSPWIGTYWYGSPYTWGYGFSFYYSWWHPWWPYYTYPYYYPVYWRPYPYYRPWWGPWVPVHQKPVRAAPRPHPIRGMIAEQYPSGTYPSANTGGIYERWGREIAKQVGAPPASTLSRSERLRPGTGYIIRDGRRFDFSDRAGTTVPGIPARRAVPDGAVGGNAARVFNRESRPIGNPREGAFARGTPPQAVTPRGPIGRSADQVFRDRPVTPARPEVRSLPERRNWQARPMPERSSPPAAVVPPRTTGDGALSRSMRAVQPRPSEPRAIPDRRAMPQAPRIQQAQPRAAPQAPPPRAVPQRPPQQAPQAQRQPRGGAMNESLRRAFGER
jgi:hypothetical protein